MGLAGFAFAQKPAQPSPQPPKPPPPVVVPCPAVTIEGPKGNVAPGETIRYSARVDTKDLAGMPQFKWTINPAAVFAGQGGPEIEFERQAMNRLTVTLEVVGLPGHCPRHATANAAWAPTPVARRLDQFAGPLTKIPDQRLNRIVNALRYQATSQLFVVLEYNDHAAEPAAKQKGHLVADLLAKSGLDSKRVSYAIGKTTRDSVQFWLVPAGAEYPKIEK